MLDRSCQSMSPLPCKWRAWRACGVTRCKKNVLKWTENCFLFLKWDLKLCLVNFNFSFACNTYRSSISSLNVFDFRRFRSYSSSSNFFTSTTRSMMCSTRFRRDDFQLSKFCIAVVTRMIPAETNNWMKRCHFQHVLRARAVKRARW